MSVKLLSHWRLQSAFVAVLFLASTAGVSHAQTGVDSAARRATLAMVKPGDRIGLHFLRERELSESLYVNERGEAAFPKIGILQVSQMSIAQLQDTLRARYAEYFRLPEFEIAVLRKVTITGDVRLPGVYLMDGASSTVRDVIARAGGVSEWGSASKVAVVRNGQRVPIKNWDRDSGPATDLQSGDLVTVGRKNWFAMNALSVISTAVLVTSFVISVAR
jgi:protein involved in polysaccharide export with SLBB domain